MQPALAAAFQMSIVVPGSALAPGNYSVEVTRTCMPGGLPGGPVMMTSRAFSIGASKPLPTDLGTVRIIPRPQGLVTAYGGSACVATADAASAGIQLDATAAFAAFQPAAVLQVMVDGRLWQGVALPGTRDTSAHDYDPYVVFAVCGDARKSPVESSLSRGKHTVEVKAFLPGVATPLVTTPVEVDLQPLCPSDPATKDDGCAVSDRRTRRAGGPGALLVIAFAAVVVAFRRATRPGCCSGRRRD